MNDYDAHTDPDRGRDEPDPIAIRLPLTTSQVLTMRNALQDAKDHARTSSGIFASVNKISHINELLALIDQEATYRPCAE